MSKLPQRYKIILKRHIFLPFFSLSTGADALLEKGGGFCAKTASFFSKSASFFSKSASFLYAPPAPSVVKALGRGYLVMINHLLTYFLPLLM
jgi:hypothetical protein